MKILLVDDSATVLTFARMMLSGEGYTLTTASSGKQALEAIGKHKPDLVLLDIVMPEMNGVECCQRIKSNPQTKDIPVIMVTTKGNRVMVEEAYAAGCDDFITKPIDKVELVEKVRSHIAGARRDIGGVG